MEELCSYCGKGAGEHFFCDLAISAEKVAQSYRALAAGKADRDDYAALEHFLPKLKAASSRVR